MYIKKLEKNKILSKENVMWDTIFVSAPMYLNASFIYF